MNQYKHYKGGIYTVIGIGLHTETEERLVAYYDEEGKVWFRPEEMFFGEVEVNGVKVRRFTPFK